MVKYFNSWYDNNHDDYNHNKQKFKDKNLWITHEGIGQKIGWWDIMIYDYNIWYMIYDYYDYNTLSIVIIIIISW